MKRQTITAIKFLLVMTILTGIVYPLCVTGLAQISYPSKANGSILRKDGKTVGSELLGQKFDSIIYFWSRPSASGYNTVPSGASNLGPTSITLRKLVSARRQFFAEMNFLNDTINIPEEMIFASASGLDPHISPEAATAQVERISLARHLNNSQKQNVLKIISESTENPQFRILGEERINVLLLNIKLDSIDNNNTNK